MPDDYNRMLMLALLHLIKAGEMARRGRPRQVSRQGFAPNDRKIITEAFSTNPIRQLVDPKFNRYYSRLQNGDPDDVLEHCNSFSILEPSFYEFVGRLVFLSELPSVKQFVMHLPRVFEKRHTLPDWVIYEHWYRRLKEECQSAREFIRRQYSVNDCCRWEEMWECYCREKFYHDSTSKNNQLGQKVIAHPQALKQDEIVKLGHVRRRDDRLYEIVEQFLRWQLVPQVIFRELADCRQTLDPRTYRDKRYRRLKFLKTPSFVARKYACAMVGLSPTSVSHKARAK